MLGLFNSGIVWGRDTGIWGSPPYLGEPGPGIAPGLWLRLPDCEPGSPRTVWVLVCSLGAFLGGMFGKACHRCPLSFIDILCPACHLQIDIPGWSQRNERNEEEHTDKHTSLVPTIYAWCAHHVLISVLSHSLSTAEQEFTASCIHSIVPYSTWGKTLGICRLATAG